MLVSAKLILSAFLHLTSVGKCVSVCVFVCLRANLMLMLSVEVEQGVTCKSYDMFGSKDKPL